MNQWAILELMGHVRLAGYVTEEKHFGAEVGRIDIPDENGGHTTQFFGGQSIYRLTPCSEEVARNVARNSQPAPVSIWEAQPPRLPAPSFVGHVHELDEDDDDDVVFEPHRHELEDHDHDEWVRTEFATAARELNEADEAPACQ